MFSSAYFLVANEIPKVGSSMGNKDKILGKFSGTWDFSLFGKRTGQMRFV